MSNADTDKLFDRAVKLAVSPDVRFLELARALVALKKADDQRYNDYLSAVKKGRRRAYYLLQIGQAFDGLDVSDAILQEIGWTKLLRIAPIVTDANVGELLAKAKSMTNRELTAALNGDGTSPPHALMFFLTSKELKLLTRHLKRHGAAGTSHGLQGKEKALMALLGHYEQLLHSSKIQSA